MEVAGGDMEIEMVEVDDHQQDGKEVSGSLKEVQKEMSSASEEDLSLGISLTWNDIYYEVKKKKGFFKNETHTRVLLNHVFGHIPVGECVAIMGPSGCGKSTLLDVLAGRVSAATSSSLASFASSFSASFSASFVEKKKLEEREEKGGGGSQGGGDDRGGYLGEVRMGGKQVVGSEMKKHVAYVMQDDALEGVLTVRENLFYSAMLRLPPSMSKEEKMERVEEVIGLLGLSKCADTKIGTPFLRGVSGGERRRCSIGMELITRPSILLLDEPTSGLDAKSSRLIVELLKKLAKTGRVVLFSIHQPSSEIYRLFDKIMLLSKGQQIFFGPSDSAVEFFQSLGFPLPPRMNPADHYLEVINRDFNERGQEEEEEDEEEEREKEDELISGMSSYFKRSSLFQKLFDDIQGADESDDEKTISTLTEAKKYETSFLTQLYYLCHRRLKINMIDFTVFWARFVLFVFMAIVIGSVYFQMGNDQDTINDRLGSLFYIVTFLSFMSISAFPAFVLEREIFIRERRNGYYTVLPYSLSHSLLCIPFLFAMTMSFSSICYYMVGFETGVDQFLYFCLVLYACLLIAEGIVMSISALAPNYIIGIIVAACIYGVFMLVGGYPLMSKYIPDYYIWIHYIVFQKYSFEGLLKNEFAGTSFDCDTYFNPASNTTDCICLHADLNQDCVLQGNEVLTEFGYEDVDKWAWLGVLFAMAFFFHTLFFFLLRFFNTGERK